VPKARPRGAPFTFAVVGRDEEKTLARVIEQAREAAIPGDRVWFVDSGSRDRSVAVARRLGVEVIHAPEGKGRAVAVAIDRCDPGYICLLDADLTEWTTNIPATLRAAAVATGADMVVGDFRNERRRMITPSIYVPLVDALFPDYQGLHAGTPLSGLRALNASIPIGEAPGGYGIETHLNLAVAAAGGSIAVAELGYVRDPLRDYANVEEVGGEVIAAILDFAVAMGRLDTELRSSWEGWAHDVLTVMVRNPPTHTSEDELRAMLDAVSSRPLPPARTRDPTGLVASQPGSAPHRLSS
jgi:glycosyltransferase involved in cell wall biosynthesis